MPRKNLLPKLLKLVMLVNLHWPDHVQSTEAEQEHLNDDNGGSCRFSNIMQIKA